MRDWRHPRELGGVKGWRSKTASGVERVSSRFGKGWKHVSRFGVGFTVEKARAALSAVSPGGLFKKFSFIGDRFRFIFFCILFFRSG